jgi:hypothetical protein
MTIEELIDDVRGKELDKFFIGTEINGVCRMELQVVGKEANRHLADYMNYHFEKWREDAFFPFRSKNYFDQRGLSCTITIKVIGWLRNPLQALTIRVSYWFLEFFYKKGILARFGYI